MYAYSPLVTQYRGVYDHIVGGYEVIDMVHDGYILYLL